jgi:hypothetical protein
MIASTLRPWLKSDHKEFFRLTGMPLPFEELHGHYMDMILRYDRSMTTRVEEFNEYVEWCHKSGYEKPSAYRIDNAMQWFIKWSKEKNPMAGELPVPLLAQPKADRRKAMNGKLLLSLDMTSANYSVMRWTADRHGVSVPDSWTKLCEELNIHPFLASCKIFRQYCFGNYMPSRYASLQKHVMAILCKGLGLTQDELVLSSHDEIVIQYPSQEDYTAFMSRVNKIIGDAGLGDFVTIKGTIYKTFAIKDEMLSMIVNEGASVVELLQKFGEGRSDSSLRIEFDHAISFDGESEDFYEKKKVLVGVSKNKFYPYLRTVVLGESLQDNDLLFENEGMVAKWLLADAKKRWVSNSETQ